MDLLDADLYTELLARPARLESKVPEKYAGWIIIDEIQKVPELLNEVHRLIETRRWKFIMTGSSARSLRRRGVNHLAGRAILYNMHPLTIAEIGSDFDLSRSLRFGHLPAVTSHDEPESYLSGCVRTSTALISMDYRPSERIIRWPNFTWFTGDRKFIRKKITRLLRHKTF